MQDLQNDLVIFQLENDQMEKIVPEFGFGIKYNINSLMEEYMIDIKTRTISHQILELFTVCDIQGYPAQNLYSFAVNLNKENGQY